MKREKLEKLIEEKLEVLGIGLRRHDSDASGWVAFHPQIPGPRETHLRVPFGLPDTRSANLRAVANGVVAGIVRAMLDEYREMVDQPCSIAS